MKKKTQIDTVAGVFICLLATYSLAEVPRTKGVISQVTVYRGQALVTRTINIDLPSGTSELIVEGLPSRIIPETLFAQTSGSTKVLSVRYRERAVEEDTREEVKKLDAQIEKIEDQLYKNRRDLDIAVWMFRHFEEQWKLSIDLANASLNKGALESEQIENLTKYLEKKNLEWQDKTVNLEFQKKGLEKELELLKRKRTELDAGRSRTEREAVLYMSNESKAKSVIELNYLVNGANWLPQYNLRANPDKSSVLIEYNAVVNQVSGEDWNGIRLYLSTAEPTMIAAAPTLEPMAITLTDLQTYDAESKISGDMIQQEGIPHSIAGLLDRSEDFKRLAKSRREQAKKGAAAQKQLLQIAMSNQVLEFAAGKKELAQIREQMEEIARIEGISVTYNLPGRLTLPSRTDQQLVTITSVTVKANFTLVATPLLTDHVYLQAEVLNDSNTIFLPGPAMMFRNGEFVGKSDQSIVTIGEKFTAGFGIDSQVQVVRELEDKKIKIQGGNRIDTYNYRIALSNYKNSPTKLRLLDRLPYTDNDSIKIELLETTPELSKDSEYLRTGRRKGILRWDLSLAPNSVDQDVTVINYSFTMEYDKNMQIQPRKTNN